MKRIIKPLAAKFGHEFVCQNGIVHTYEAIASPQSTGYAWEQRLDRGGHNALDLIRLVLAILVVWEHSFFLIYGRLDGDPLFQLSNGQVHTGKFAVYMFFSISGFLVTRSRVMSLNVNGYLKKRVARIVPGFPVATFIGCAVIAPLTSNNPLHFFANQNWSGIIVSALALKQVAVSGALEGNPVGLILGTLWTIKYEFDCYLMIGLLGSLGLLSPRRTCCTFLCCAVILLVARANVDSLPIIDHGLLALLISSPRAWPELFPFFFAGSALYVFRNRIPKSNIIAFACILLIVCSHFLGGMYWILLFCGTYLVMFLGLSFTAEPKMFHARVDLSYGIYLYGWPIAQLTLFLTAQSLAPIPLFVISTILTFPVTYLSWRWIERPSLILARRHGL